MSDKQPRTGYPRAGSQWILDNDICTVLGITNQGEPAIYLQQTVLFERTADSGRLLSCLLTYWNAIAVMHKPALRNGCESCED